MVACAPSNVVLDTVRGGLGLGCDWTGSGIAF